jgi:hypothetical protein
MLSRRMRLLTVAVPVGASLALAGPALAGETKGDKAILKAGVITKADVPAEWTSTKASSSDAVKGIKECRKINAAVAEAKKNEARAQSREFSDAPAEQARSQAENTVYAFSDKKGVGRFISAFEGTAATNCFQALGAELARNQPSTGPPTVQPITDLQGVGDEAIGYEIASTYTAEGGAATLYVDFVIVRVGRAGLAFVFANVGARIPQGPGIVNAVVQRVSAAEA